MGEYFFLLLISVTQLSAGSVVVYRRGMLTLNFPRRLNFASAHVLTVKAFVVRLAAECHAHFHPCPRHDMSATPRSGAMGIISGNNPKSR